MALNSVVQLYYAWRSMGILLEETEKAKEMKGDFTVMLTWFEVQMYVAFAFSAASISFTFLHDGFKLAAQMRKPEQCCAAHDHPGTHRSHGTEVLAGVLPAAHSSTCSLSESVALSPRLTWQFTRCRRSVRFWRWSEDLVILTRNASR